MVGAVGNYVFAVIGRQAVKPRKLTLPENESNGVDGARRGKNGEKKGYTRGKGVRGREVGGTRRSCWSKEYSLPSRWSVAPNGSLRLYLLAPHERGAPAANIRRNPPRFGAHVAPLFRWYNNIDVSLALAHRRRTRIGFRTVHG